MQYSFMQIVNSEKPLSMFDCINHIGYFELIAKICIPSLEMSYIMTVSIRNSLNCIISE